MLKHSKDFEFYNYTMPVCYRSPSFYNIQHIISEKTTKPVDIANYLTNDSNRKPVAYFLEYEIIIIVRGDKLWKIEIKRPG